jgi:membrane protein
MKQRAIQTALGVVARSPTFLKDLASFVAFAMRRFYADNLGQSAGALTYTTLLALVPLMVITFAILAGFPAFDTVSMRIQNLIFEALVPEIGDEIANYLSRFSINATNLTAVGIAALAFTAVLLLWTIEATLNQIWRVEQPRPIGVRILIYWTVLTLGPLLLGVSFILTSSAFATAVEWAERGVATERIDAAASGFTVAFAVLSQMLAFTLLFKLVPARPVRLKHAALGGVISGFAFYFLRWGFNQFVTASSTYQTIYGAVAVLPLFLVWIYASWTVIIFGAVFAASFPDWWKTRDPEPGRHLSPARRLEVAVAILSVLARKSREGGGVPPSVLQEAAPLDVRDDLIEALSRCGYLVTTDQEYIALSRDIYVTTVGDLARDLELALGLAPESEDENDPRHEALDALAETTGALPQMLGELHDAECSILNRPLADVISPDTGPGHRFKLVRRGSGA